MINVISSAEITIYMLLSNEARLNAQAKLLIEIAHILTQKDPDTIKKEFAHDAIIEH